MRAGYGVGRWALAAVVCACAGPPAVSPDVPPEAPATATPAPAATGPRPLSARVVALEGDGRVMPVALAPGRAPLLFATGPEGLTRTALDLDAGLARPGRATRLDYRVPGQSSAYDVRTDALFWTAPLETRTVQEPLGAATLTTSHRVGAESGMTGTVRACPAREPLAAGSDCDHTMRAAAMVPEGLLLGGALRAPAAAGAAPWLGLVSRAGALVAERTLDRAAAGGLPSGVAALAAGPKGVLVAGHTERGLPSIGWLAVLHGPDWTSPDRPIQTFGGLAERAWVAVVPGSGADFWVAWPRGSSEIVLFDVSDAAELVGERSVGGLDLSAGLTISMHPARVLWLLVCENGFGSAQKKLRLFPLGSSAGAPPVEHALELPAGFFAHAVAWTDGRALVAGRIGTERPVLLVVDLPDAPAG